MIKIKKISAIGFGFIVFLSFFFNIYLFRKNQSLAPKNIVTSVVDGDTIVLNGFRRVRLSNIYAPELKFCGGEEAKKRLEEMILNKNIKMETSSEDIYNRDLALIYFKEELINETLLREGLARYDGTPNPKREQMKKAYDFAVANKKGIHGPPCRAEKPDNSECLIKSNIERASGEKWYFFPGCQSYNSVMVEKDLGEKWFCSEKEAREAGFEKGANCFNKIYR